MKKLLKTDLDVALLLVRLGLGLGFLAHGVQKLQGLDGVVGFFGSLGMPAFMAYVVALVETLGGLAMILGVFTEYAGLSLAAVMVGAIALVKMKMLGDKGYVGMELDVMYLLSALAIAFAGPGKYAVKMGAAPSQAPTEPKKA